MVRGMPVGTYYTGVCHSTVSVTRGGNLGNPCSKFYYCKCSQSANISRISYLEFWGCFFSFIAVALHGYFILIVWFENNLKDYMTRGEGPVLF